LIASNSLAALTPIPMFVEVRVVEIRVVETRIMK
jgi:hypothetical protein